MTYTAIIEQGNNGWYVAQCAEIPGAISQGKTIDEAEENLKDALKLLLETSDSIVPNNAIGKVIAAPSKPNRFSKPVRFSPADSCVPNATTRKAIGAAHQGIGKRYANTKELFADLYS
jgi:predicted RNase H-like HicB family nuclease